MPTHQHKRILVAPLDWGLGHTTRCISLMQHLQHIGHHVLFAGNDSQCQYIHKSLGGIETIDLVGYNVRYSKTAAGFKWSLVAQLPRLLRSIRGEHTWLKAAIREYNIDGVISDNRYGLFHTETPCVIMTHQLQVQTGMGNTVDNIVRRLHYKYLERFNECWVVDVPGVHNLSGQLAHPASMPVNAKYLGLLSQMAQGIPANSNANHLLILLSGPEPQRTMLADMLWKQVVDLNRKVVFVEGSNRVKARERIPRNVSYHLQLTKEELEPLLRDASIVVCRSGYSTLMDLVALVKEAIVIPTPGQTEQEYLGRHLHDHGMFISQQQQGFSLKQALADADDFPFNKLQLQHAHQQYIPVLESWVASL